MPPNPPQSLAGLSYLFHTGGTPDQLIFQTNESGIEIEDNPKEDDDNPNKFFTYSYVLTSESSATLIVNLPNNRRDEYFLTFTLGQQGTFLREEYRDDRLDDTDRGAFSPTNLPSDLPPPPAEFNSLPNQIQGLTLTAFSGEDPERLVFQTASSGVEFDDSAPSQFTYSWSSTGEKSLQLIITFKTDKWDEYTLTYTEAQGGSFVRREFKKGELDDTDTGRFTLTPTN